MENNQYALVKYEIGRELCEFYGILMGDGCISKYTTCTGYSKCDIVITSDKRYEEAYHLYIKSILSKKFNVNCYIYKYKNENTIRLFVRNKLFSQILIELGFPVGKKYEKLIIPDYFLSLGWEKLRYLIRGIFDTDGSIFAKKNEGYRYPYICISSKSKKLRDQILEILKAKRYPFYLNNDNLFMKGIKNINRWMNDVGSSNPKHNFKYKHWLHHRILPARLELDGLVIQSGRT